MPKFSRQSEGETLDQTDAAIIAALTRNARMSNRQLAALTGIAESTAHARLRSLEERGVVAGYEAVVSQQAMGNSIQALIGVSLRAGTRQSNIVKFTEHVRGLHEVTQYFFVGGVDDFVIHAALADSSALRTFVVDQISGHDSVASTRTSIVFEFARSSSPASFS